MARSRNIDLGLAFLQILALVAAGSSVVCTILLYHHLSSDYFLPRLEYLASFRIAAPPLAILGGSYLFALVTSQPLTDAPKALWSWLRNRFFQEAAWLLAFSSVGIAACLGAVVEITRTAPPEYSRFVHLLLAGESDDLLIVRKEIARIRTRNSDYADDMEDVLRVFSERRPWSYESKVPSTTVPRLLYLTLNGESDRDEEWESHPLRLHAAAEAASMYAQALASSSTTPFAERWRDSAVELYKKVLNSRDVRSLPALKRSAQNNIGNVNYYVGDLETALASYESITADDTSVGASGNAVAIRILLGRPAEALVWGKRAKEKAIENGKALSEPVPFSNLASNLGFAYWVRSDWGGALTEMQTAFDLVPDRNSALNLSLARLFAGDSHGAISAMRVLPEPTVSAASLASVVEAGSAGTCTYLVRGLVLDSVSIEDSRNEARLNYLAFLGKVVPAVDLQAFDDSRSRALKEEVYIYMSESSTACASLLHVPAVSAILKGPRETEAG